MDMSLLKNMRPAGTTLQANESLPINCNNGRVRRAARLERSVSSSSLHPREMLASIFTESSMMPMNSICWAGPDVFPRLTNWHVEQLAYLKHH